MMFCIQDEDITQSPHSPGVVRENEELIRVSYAPEHIEGGVLQEAAISTKDLDHRGFSLDRYDYCDLNIIRRRIEEQIMRQPDKREDAFASMAECADVRALMDHEKNERLFVVIDIINENEETINKAHAAIYSAFKRGPGTLKKLRKILLPHFANLISAEEFMAKLVQDRA